MEKKKVQEVVDWPVLRSMKDVQKFLGWQTIIDSLSKILQGQQNEMTRKDIKWNWGERQQREFEELKKRFMTELVLITSDLNKEIRVEVDMSDFTMGEVLLMKCEDKKWRLVAYILKLLNKAERNYKIHNKEMLVIIQYLIAQRHFLKGVKGQFKI